MEKENNKKIPDDSLVIMVGIPGSGKSTLAKEIAYDVNEIVSTDKIRGEINGSEASQSNANDVFKEFHRRIEEKLKNGELAIADATSIQEYSRHNLYNIAQKYSRPISIIIMNISLEQCLAQNNKRERKVPEDVIKRMFNDLKIEYEKIREEAKILPDARVYDIVSTKKEKDDDQRVI